MITNVFLMLVHRFSCLVLNLTLYDVKKPFHLALTSTNACFMVVSGEGGTLIRIKVGFGIGGLLFIVILLTVIGYCILKKWPKRTILSKENDVSSCFQNQKNLRAVVALTYVSPRKKHH